MSTAVKLMLRGCQLVAVSMATVIYWWKLWCRKFLEKKIWRRGKMGEKAGWLSMMKEDRIKPSGWRSMTSCMLYITIYSRAFYFHDNSPRNTLENSGTSLIYNWWYSSYSMMQNVGVHTHECKTSRNKWTPGNQRNKKVVYSI